MQKAAEGLLFVWKNDGMPWGVGDAAPYGMRRRECGYAGGQSRPPLRMDRRCGRRIIKKHRSHEKISGEAVFYVDKAGTSMVQ